MTSKKERFEYFKKDEDKKEFNKQSFEILFDKFWGTYKERIIDEIKKLDILENTDLAFHWQKNPDKLYQNLQNFPGEGIKDKLLNREKAYCETVINGLIRAQKENSKKALIALWDIDGNIGYAPNFSLGKRVLRPSQLSLMEFINNNFQDIRHGVDSSENKIIQTLEADKEYKNAFTKDISHFFDKDLLFSSSFTANPIREIYDQKDQNLQKGITSLIEAKYFGNEVLSRYLNAPKMTTKLQVLAYAQDKNPDSFVVIIDDDFSQEDSGDSSRIISTNESKFN